MLGALSLVACLWMFEVMPLPVSAILPMALLPLLGVLDGATTAKLYWNHMCAARPPAAGERTYASAFPAAAVCTLPPLTITLPILRCAAP